MRAARIREICQSIILIAHFNGKHRETHQESIGRQHIKELRLLDIEADKYRSRLIASFNSMTARERDDKKRRAAQKKALRVYADPGVRIDSKERLKMVQKNWR